MSQREEIYNYRTTKNNAALLYFPDHIVSYIEGETYKSVTCEGDKVYVEHSNGMLHVLRPTAYEYKKQLTVKAGYH